MLRCTAALLLAATALGPAHASSAMHEAAAKRLKQKMGAIRGTIAPADRAVMLTEDLIDRWRPIASVPMRRELPSDLAMADGSIPKGDPAAPHDQRALDDIMTKVDGVLKESRKRN